MRQSKAILSNLLLAVYLPLLMFASFHVHPSSCCNADAKQASSSTVLQEPECLICQFLQTPFEESSQGMASIILPEAKVATVSWNDEIFSSFSPSSSSRAPPVLLPIL